MQLCSRGCAWGSHVSVASPAQVHCHSAAIAPIHVTETGTENGSKKLAGPMVRDVGGLLSRRVALHQHLERGALVKPARVDGALGPHAHACACSYYRGGCAQRRAKLVMAGAPFSMVARASSQRAPFHCARQLRDGRVCRCEVSSARRFSCACMSD